MRRNLLVLVLALGCHRAADSRDAPTDAPCQAAPASSAKPAAPPARRSELTLVAGGDVSFGRAHGKALLDDPRRDFFAPLRDVLASADVRFVNLEGPIADRNGELVHPENNLIFCGPPSGADALARGAITLVSLANNHAWDYGKEALLETMDHLERAGVRYVGAGRSRAEAYAPLVLDEGGFRVAFLAVTDIWNQGPLSKHAGADHVAAADAARLAGAVRAARAAAGIDAVVVSYHGGSEYLDEPITRTKEILRAAIDAGADAVIGHHPHVVHGVEWRRGRPIFYSLGNLLMRMHSDHVWTGTSFLARLRLRRGEAPTAEVCPFHILGLEARPFAAGPDADAREAQIFGHLRAISKVVGGVTIGPRGDHGCAPIEAESSPNRLAVADSELAARRPKAELREHGSD